MAPTGLSQSSQQVAPKMQDTLEVSKAERTLDRLLAEHQWIDARVSELQTEVQLLARRANSGASG